MSSNNTPSSLICFKNGYSYVNIPVPLPNKQSGDSDTDIKSCEVGPVPNFAVHGTLAIEPCDPRIVKIFSISKTKKVAKKLSPLKISKKDGNGKVSFKTILMENIGSWVSLKCLFDSRREETFVGLVKAVHDDFEGTGDSLIVLKGLNGNGFLSVKESLIKCSNILYLQTASNAEWKNYDSSDDESGEEDKSKKLSIRYALSKEHNQKTVDVNLSYLTRGLMWAPSYMLRQDRNTKTLTLQGNACLICDLPFLVGDPIASISLVAGHPKMECKDVNDPLVSGASAGTFIEQLGVGKYSSNRGHRAFISQECSSRAYSMRDEYDFAEGVEDGENMDDLYFYKLKNVPLQNNCPINLPFIETTRPESYQDVYFFDLNNKDRDGGKDESIFEATHAITFKNTCGQPLTTGPVSVLLSEDTKQPDTGTKQEDVSMKRVGNRFLVQGKMSFTGINKAAIVEMTKALDVDGKFVVETMKDRDVEKKKKIQDKEYELVVVKKKATFTVSNMKNEDVKCKVDYLLHGHLVKAEPNYKEVTESHTGHHDLNPKTKYVWEINVPKQGKSELVFEYCIKKWTKVVEDAVSTTDYDDDEMV